MRISIVSFDEKTTSLDKIVMTHSPCLKELRVITKNDDAYWFSSKQRQGVIKSLESGDWSEYLSICGERYPQTTPYMHHFDGTVYNIKNVPLFYNLIIENVCEISSADFLKIQLEQSAIKPPSEFYPIAVRYINSDGVYFIERPPFQVTLNMRSTNNKSSDKKIPPVTFWVPWTIVAFFPKTQEFRLYFSYKSLDSMEDTYIVSPLPNTYSDGRICFGNSIYGMSGLIPDIDSSDIRSAYSVMFNEFMNGGWNYDLSPNILRFIHQIRQDNTLEFLEKEYPAIFNFLNPNMDDIKAKISNLTKAQARTMGVTAEYLRNSWGVNNYQLYRYFFNVLSTYSLEETLEFYREIHDCLLKNYNIKNKYSYMNNIFTFEEVSKICSNQNDKVLTTYKSLHHELYSHISNKRIEDLPRKYAANETLTNIAFVNYEESLKITSNPAQVISKIPLHKFMEIINALKKDPLTNLDVIIYDFAIDDWAIIRPNDFRVSEETKIKYSAQLIAELTKEYAGQPVLLGV